MMKTRFHEVAIGLALITCAALPARALAQCSIDGPANVDEGQRFTLCAPAGYTYRWAGPGLPNGATSRCITVGGRSSGLYEYTVSLYSRGALSDRCMQVVTVGDTPTPEDQCAITGPPTVDPGEVVELCGPPSTFDVHDYAWAGPGGFRASTRCVRVSRSGLYTLTTRNQVTGHQRRCTHRLDASGPSGPEDCSITGPDTFEPGTRVQLCGPSGAFSYRWTGPGNFSSTSSCISTNREGTYTLSIRDRYGDVRTCTRFLDLSEGSDDSEQPFTENCPRNYAFWSAVCRGARNDVSAAELATIARCVDERSQALNWTDDASGLCQALRPTGPLTQRKQATRQLAALLANLCAAELGIAAQNGQSIGLDADTPISFRNARTVGELAALIDRMLARGRGNFAQANATMQGVNNGRGIGSVCSE